MIYVYSYVYLGIYVCIYKAIDSTYYQYQSYAAKPPKRIITYSYMNRCTYVLYVCIIHVLGLLSLVSLVYFSKQTFR